MPDTPDPEYHEHVAGDEHAHPFNGPHSHGGVSALRSPTMPDATCVRDGMVCTTHDALFSSRQDRCEYEHFSDMDSGSPTMPDTLSRESMQEIRDRHPDDTESEVARLLAHIDAMTAADGGWNIAHGLAIDVLGAEVPDGVREHAEEVERQYWALEPHDA